MQHFRFTSKQAVITTNPRAATPEVVTTAIMFVELCKNPLEPSGAGKQGNFVERALTTDVNENMIYRKYTIISAR